MSAPTEDAVARVRDALDLAPDHAKLTAIWTCPIPEDVVEGDECDLPVTVADLRAVLARLAECERDAARYRFLRDNPLQLRAIDGNATWYNKPAQVMDEHTDIAMREYAAREGVLSDGSVVRFIEHGNGCRWRRYKSSAVTESPTMIADKWTSLLTLADTGADFDALKSFAAGVGR